MLYCCWYPVLEVFSTQLFKLAVFMGSLFVVPISLITMCDMFPLLQLICTDTFFIGVLIVANGGLICTLVFLLLLVSYGVILHSLKNLSQAGRQKALQTCSSHITVVVCFIVPSIFMYARPAKTFPIEKSLKMFYTVISPMLNPLIYSLRSSEIMNAIKKLWAGKVRSSCN